MPKDNNQLRQWIAGIMFGGDSTNKEAIEGILLLIRNQRAEDCRWLRKELLEIEKKQMFEGAPQAISSAIRLLDTLEKQGHD